MAFPHLLSKTPLRRRQFLQLFPGKNSDMEVLLVISIKRLIKK
ncbi:hypothetical protein KIS1582_0788 [Cytobacillus firmus]|uniref:Uncharacterized protein n=1 Tax=Cytobacillus firmus TaxID=1399 RepID=A0A800NEX6_CYTFI|nr:hypothetical protein KIS1582_0788 [Cytobacillus firmus]